MESGGERYYVCVIGQISLACEGKKKVISSTGLANEESEREGGWMSQLCPF